MSQENVEIVRKALEALDPDLDAVTEFWHPEIDWRAIEGAPDDIGVFTGHAAMRHYYEQWFETFAELRAEIEDMVDAGGQVVVSLHVIGKMEGTQAEFDMRLGIVFTVRGGLIVRGREYATPEKALEAAGLKEEAMSQENVEKLREAYELLNAQFDSLKGGDLDLLLAFFDPHVVIELADAPDPERYEGHEGVRKWFRDTFSVWETLHIEAEEFIEIGDWTVVHLRSRVRGEASGVELEIPFTATHRFRNGKIVHDRVYLDRAEALEAAGLEE